MTPALWSHAQLVEMAGTWLRSRCPVVITEMASWAGEEPDAIGWRSRGSILVECKASRADLRADKDKPYRRTEPISADGTRWAGLGDERYFMVPAGMVELDDPLLTPGWGVLFVSDKGAVREKRKAEYRPGDVRGERALLVSCIRRLGVASAGGCSVKIYTEQTKCRATVAVRRAPEKSSFALQFAELRLLLHQANEDLAWMSGASDFAEGGQAHEGWTKVRQRLHERLGATSAGPLRSDCASIEEWRARTHEWMRARARNGAPQP